MKFFTWNNMTQVNEIKFNNLSSIYFASCLSPISLSLIAYKSSSRAVPYTFFSLLVSAQYLLPPLSFPPPPPILKWGPKSGQYRGFVVC
jgi:hypothetical protein